MYILQVEHAAASRFVDVNISYSYTVNATKLLLIQWLSSPSIL